MMDTGEVIVPQSMVIITNTLIEIPESMYRLLIEIPESNVQILLLFPGRPQ